MVGRGGRSKQLVSQSPTLKVAPESFLASAFMAQHAQKDSGQESSCEILFSFSLVKDLGLSPC